MLLPGLLVIFLGFEAGGYFAGSTGVAAAATAVLLAVRVLTAAAPWRGLSVTGAITLIGAAALAALTLWSQTWSHAEARAMLSFDLVVLYLVFTTLYRAFPTTPAQVRTLICGLVFGLTIVCGAGLLTRLLPLTFPLPASLQNPRLAYPLTYWNALGMVCALGVALCIHLACDRDGHLVLRVLAAALVPMFGVTLLLTFSRGAIGSLGIVLVVYVLLAARWSMVTTAIAAGLPSLLALRVAYDASALTVNPLNSPAAVHQGHHVLGVLLIAMALAGVLQGALTLAEGRVRIPGVPPLSRIVWAVTAVAVVVALIAGGASWVGHQYDTFVHGSLSSTGPTRNRLLSIANDGRIGLWKVALHAFDRQPLHGTGAGTYAEQWTQHRTELSSVQDAHSLYMETLSDLGVLGGVALALFLGGLLAGAVTRLRARATRPAAAIAVATLAGWLVHSAVDWDWQMPAVMVPVMALTAAVAAVGRGATAPAADVTARTGESSRVGRLTPAGAPLRIGVAVVSIALAVIPAEVAVSQSHLNAAVAAFSAGNCSRAVGDARAAHSAVGARPEPLEVIGYCEGIDHQSDASIATIQAAISRDPDDWQFHYALGIVSAEAGRNPLPALRAAYRLDPLEGSIRDAYEALRKVPRRRLRATALAQPLDV